MEEEPEPELGKAYLDELAAVLDVIDALPLVNSVALVGQPGDKLTNIKVRANLDAEFVVDPKKKRRPAVCLSKERPTQLHAARALLATLRSSEKGGYAEELAAAEAAAAGRQAAGASSATESSHGMLAPLPWLPCLAAAALRLARDPFSYDDSRSARAATAVSNPLSHDDSRPACPTTAPADADGLCWIACAQAQPAHRQHSARRLPSKG